MTVFPVFLISNSKHFYYRLLFVLIDKFFCIPHSTDNSLEKYRYRKKEDEIRDADARQRELASTEVTSEWGGKSERPKRPSLSETHRRRLMDHDRRGSTPER